LTSLDLLSLSDLSNLTVSGAFAVSGCRLLESLKGPTLLESVTSLMVGDNPVLRRVDMEVQARSLELVSLNDNGRLESLEGLNGLREAGFLGLSNSPVASLATLESLERTDALLLQGLDLTDLGALASVRIQSLMLEGLPNLGSLVGLRAATRMDTVILDNTGVRDLEPLRSLERVHSFGLHQNAELQDIDALDGVVGLQVLSVSSNPRLVSMPSMGLDAPLAIDLSFNDSLRVAPSFPGLQNAVDASVHVVGNPVLEAFDSLDGVMAVNTLIVSDNAALTQLGLTALSRALVLRIACNPALSQSSIQPVADRVDAPLTELEGNLDSILTCPVQ
jgi:Leucine-rich repeat (LRR) protein